MIARNSWLAVLSLCILVLSASCAAAEDFAAGASWASLAADRLASGPGDQLTVLVEENATASDTTVNTVAKKTTAAGELSTGASHLVGRGALNLNSGFDGSGQAAQSERMIASVGVTVVAVAPNGDLVVAGEQSLDINGERSHIRVHGRVRRVDISSDNTVVSTRLADAQIEYNGQGFVGRSARPGLITRALTGLGLF